jgi:WD40 repeat protein
LTLASSGDDGHVRLWDVASAKELRAFDEWKQSVPCLAFHPDGSQLAAVGADGVVRLWTVDSGVLNATLNPN